MHSSSTLQIINTLFINNEDRAPSLKVDFIFKIFRAESSLTVDQKFEQIN